MTINVKKSNSKTRARRITEYKKPDTTKRAYDLVHAKVDELQDSWDDYMDYADPVELSSVMEAQLGDILSSYGDTVRALPKGAVNAITREHVRCMKYAMKDLKGWEEERKRETEEYNRTMANIAKKMKKVKHFMKTFATIFTAKDLALIATGVADNHVAYRAWEAKQPQDECGECGHKLPRQKVGKVAGRRGGMKSRGGKRFGKAGR